MVRRPGDEYEYENRITEMVCDLCNAMGFDWSGYDSDSCDVQDVLRDAVPHALCLRRHAENLGFTFQGFGALTDKAFNDALDGDMSDDLEALAIFVRTSDDEGVKLISQERRRHHTVEGWSTEHDDSHNKGEMARAAVAYTLGSFQRYNGISRFWPWDRSWWKPASAVRMLVKAGSLIAAEIGRLRRLGEA